MTSNKDEVISCNEVAATPMQSTLQQPVSDSTLPQALKSLTSREKKRMDPTRMAMSPKPGFIWNSLKKLPRNMPCPCQSGKKFKACHLNMLPPVVPEKIAKSYIEAMKRPGGIKFLIDDKK